MKSRRIGFRDVIRWMTGFQVGRPDWLILEATNHCNLQCPVCGAGNGSLSMEKGYLPKSQFASLASAADRLRPKAVCLHARGEPLLHPDLSALIEMLHKKGLHTHLATNGMLLTKQLARGLRQAGLDQLVISHPGLTPANYRACRGVAMRPGFEDGLMDALQAWQGSDGDVIIRSLVLPGLDTNGPGEVSRFLKKWLVHPAVRRVEFTGYQPWPLHVSEAWLPGIQSKPRICSLAFDRLTMLWDGTLTPCSDDITAALSLGKWPQTGFRDAFNGHKVRRIRRAHMHKSLDRHPLCRHCLLPRVSAPIVHAERREVAHRSGDGLGAWYERKGRKMWRLLQA